MTALKFSTSWQWMHSFNFHVFLGFYFFCAVRIVWNNQIWNWHRNSIEVLMSCKQEKRVAGSGRQNWVLPPVVHRVKHRQSGWSRIPGAPGSDALVKQSSCRTWAAEQRRNVNVALLLSGRHRPATTFFLFRTASVSSCPSFLYFCFISESESRWHNKDL